MDYRIEQLRYQLREDPSSRIFYQLGELLRREGEAAQAVDILRSGLERHPRYVSAWVCLGRSQRDLRALEEARQSFQTALDLDRENPVAARLLGETAVELDDWLGAVKALKLTRALAGADDELDAQITMVENHLDQDGRLDRPRPATPAVRCLDVVNLSADDPFSASSEDDDVSEAEDDVFRVAEDSAEVAVDEALEEEHELDSAAAEVETVEDPGEVSVDRAPIVDESSVGAWSTTMSAAGVSGEEAWAEPSAEIVTADTVSSDDPWAEPGAAFEVVESVTEETVTEEYGAADVVDEVETVIDDEPPLEDDQTELETELDDQPEDLEPEPVAADEVAETDDDLGSPVETHEFDSIEVTHPIVVEKRVADTEERAPVEAAEELVSDKARDDFQEATGDDLSGDDIEIADKRHELEHGVPLPTMTLAKLALQQDDRPLAMATLESLIERDPTNTEAIAMLDELRAREATFANERLRAVRATTKIAALQGWLDAVRLAAERRVQ